MDPDGMALSFNGLGDPTFQRLKELLDSHRSLPKYPALLASTPAMRAVQEIINGVADTNTTVLIRGESGVGKELVARAIHAASPRHAHPFVKVNCAALPAELLESELFGHEKGAFTGAYRRKLGKFEFANKGTLFLDEIGELPHPLQAKLLHVLQDQEFSRVGGRELIRVDTRILASTNRNLEVALAAGQFREDLYYRLNVVEIRVPPLRERREEIPILVEVFLEEFQRQYGRKVELSPETMRCFTEYPWPGNVRELENLVKRLVVLGNVGKIQEELLSGLRNNDGNGSKGAGADENPNPPAQLDFSVGLRELGRRAARAAERRVIEEVLEQVRWNRSEAARVLKISYKTLLTRITECGLGPKKRRRKDSP
jgi:two-component system response regulator AtoC